MLRDLKHIAAIMRSTRHASVAYVLRSLLLAAALMQMAEGTIILMVHAFKCSVLLAGKSVKLFSPLANIPCVLSVFCLWHLPPASKIAFKFHGVSTASVPRHD